ncbi:MAG: CbiX/SirB N-terminal domain-containing protein [Planctomycetota bacterium]
MSETKRAILIVDHGSRRAESNDSLSSVAELVAQVAVNFHVEWAHMELAHPNIEEGFRACVEAGAVEVIVHPYMLGPGRHASSDIPRLVDEAASLFPGVRYSVTSPLGADLRIAEVVLQRVQEAAARDPAEQENETNV